MSFIYWLAAFATALYALHRLASWMEDRGWIYYRKTRGRRDAYGSAFLEIQSMFEPGKRHVLEIKQQEQVEEDESGDPPRAGETGKVTRRKLTPPRH